MSTKIAREAQQRGAHGLLFVVGLALMLVIGAWLATTPPPPIDWQCPPPSADHMPCLDDGGR